MFLSCTCNARFPYLFKVAAAAAAKSLQSCPTLSDHMDCSLPGSSVHGTFQARVLEWGAIAFSEELAIPTVIQQYVGDKVP